MQKIKVGLENNNKFIQLVDFNFDIVEKNSWIHVPIMHTKLSMKGYGLSDGEIIKLGKVIFRVKIGNS